MTSVPTDDVAVAAVRMFPPASNRAAWNRAAAVHRNALFRERLTAQAEEALASPIPEPTASRYMDFIRTGDRRGYETPYFARRDTLEILVLAEAFEYRGRFLDRIVDYVWAILNEYPWTVPAHAPRTPEGQRPDPLQDAPYETVDLFCADTGMVLAQTLNLLGDALERLSPALVRRVREHLERRVVRALELDPFPFWWGDGHNNWTPWCCSNALGVVLTVLDHEPERRARLAERLLGFIDNYLERYPEDGACDEGPTYWSVSPVVLLVFLEQLHAATSGRVTRYDHPKIRAMGEYIVDCHIAGDHYAAFADAGTRMTLPAAVAYRYGERVGSEKLKTFALAALRRFGEGGFLRPPIRSSALFRSLAHIFWLPDETAEPSLPASSTAWYPRTEVLFSRAGRLAFAAKGGHNGENHNHNDVGQFILALDGRMMVVDPGRTEYTRFTFSKHRYEHWVLNARGHDVAAFNDVLQHEGSEYRAAGAACAVEETGCRLSMELAGAYPKAAGLESYTRSLLFDHQAQRLDFHDAWRLDRDDNVVTLPLYTPAAVDVVPGRLRLENGGAVLVVTFPDTCEVAREAVDFRGDPVLGEAWAEGLTRITLTVRCGRVGGLSLTFAPGE